MLHGMRKLACLAAVLAVAVPVASAARGRDPHAERLRLTRADTAAAARTDLRRADLGSGWIALRPAPFDASEDPCPSFDPDFSGFTITGRAHSRFQHPTGAAIESEVDVFRSASDARQDFEAGAKPALVRCMRTMFERNPPAGARFVSGRTAAAPGLGDRSALYRFRFELTALGRRIPLAADFLVFQRGRTIATLFAANLRRPLPGELALARAMATRAR
jgi:hypothetical protein